MVVEPLLAEFRHIRLMQLIPDLRRYFVRSIWRRLGLSSTPHGLSGLLRHIHPVTASVRNRVLGNAFDQLSSPIGPRVGMCLERQLRAIQSYCAQDRFLRKPAPGIALALQIRCGVQGRPDAIRVQHVKPHRHEHDGVALRGDELGNWKRPGLSSGP